MLSEKRLESLQKKSILLARRIEEQEKHPSFDTTTLRHLKKQKLEIKEVMEGLKDDSTTMH